MKKRERKKVLLTQSTNILIKTNKMIYMEQNGSKASKLLTTLQKKTSNDDVSTTCIRSSYVKCLRTLLPLTTQSNYHLFMYVLLVDCSKDWKLFIIKLTIVFTVSRSPAVWASKLTQLSVERKNKECNSAGIFNINARFLHSHDMCIWIDNQFFYASLKPCLHTLHKTQLQLLL